MKEFLEFFDNNTKEIEKNFAAINELKEEQAYLTRNRLMELEAEIARENPQFKTYSTRSSKSRNTSYWSAETEARERNQSLLA